MKCKNRISQLTLELYYKGLATYKERRQVEKALKTDIDVQNRYKAIQESEKEFRKSFSQDLIRLELQKIPTVPISNIKKIVIGFIATATILLCVFIPTYLYIKHINPNKNNAITEVSDELFIENDNSVIISNGIDEKYYEDNTKTPEKTSPKNKPETQQEENSGQQTDTTNPSQQEDDSGIPPGITLIFENMFADKSIIWIDIPDRIRKIAKNAYAGNPVLIVTIGANVDVHDEAIPGKFAKAYNSYGKDAGTYSRPDSNSEVWEKE